MTQSLLEEMRALVAMDPDFDLSNPGQFGGMEGLFRDLRGGWTLKGECFNQSYGDTYKDDPVRIKALKALNAHFTSEERKLINETYSQRWLTVFLNGLGKISSKWALIRSTSYTPELAVEKDGSLLITLVYKGPFEVNNLEDQVPTTLFDSHLSIKFSFSITSDKTVTLKTLEMDAQTRNQLCLPPLMISEKKHLDIPLTWKEIFTDWVDRASDFISGIISGIFQTATNWFWDFFSSQPSQSIIHVVSAVPLHLPPINAPPPSSSSSEGSEPGLSGSLGFAINKD